MAEFIGTIEDDGLIGSLFSDTITGDLGDDLLVGLNGDDLLDGAKARMCWLAALAMTSILPMALPGIGR